LIPSPQPSPKGRGGFYNTLLREKGQVEFLDDHYPGVSDLSEKRAADEYY